MGIISKGILPTKLEIKKVQIKNKNKNLQTKLDETLDNTSTNFTFRDEKRPWKEKKL